MANLTNKTLLAGVAGAWLIAAAVLVFTRPSPMAAHAGAPSVVVPVR